MNEILQEALGEHVLLTSKPTDAQGDIPSVDEIRRVTGWIVRTRELIGAEKSDDDRLLERLLKSLPTDGEG